ncbi:MAG: hypothetical protein ACE5HP_00160 [Gemmatimonadota bacterium]
MPGSEPADALAGDAPPEAVLLERLEAAVERLLEAYGDARQRAEEAETAHQKLRAALEASPSRPGGGEDVESRLEKLAEENRALRELLLQARERAERIRSRLRVVEDEL